MISHYFVNTMLFAFKHCMILETCRRIAFEELTNPTTGNILPRSGCDVMRAGCVFWVYGVTVYVLIIESFERYELFGLWLIFAGNIFNSRHWNGGPNLTVVTFHHVAFNTKELTARVMLASFSRWSNMAAFSCCLIPNIFTCACMVQNKKKKNRPIVLDGRCYVLYFAYVTLL